MRAVVLGAGGLLGAELVARAGDHEVASFTRKQLDIRDTDALDRTLREFRPGWVLNAAAFADVDGAERKRDLAFAVNATAVGELARLCESLDCGLLQFSTDYVFPGDKLDCFSEGDETAPLNSYGASKEAGEGLVRESGARHLIVRTQWLFGRDGRSFLSTVRRRAAHREALRVVSDEYGCCTHVADLASVSWEVLGRLTGTYHVANRGRVSRYDVARRIYEAAGAGDLVTPAAGASIPVVARRPVSSQLCVDKIERELGRPMPHWTEAVDRYLATVA